MVWYCKNCCLKLLRTGKEMYWCGRCNKIASIDELRKFNEDD